MPNDPTTATNTPTVATKPEGVPDKFWNASTGSVDVSGLARSYTELERSYSSRGLPPSSQSAPTAPSAPVHAPNPSTAFAEAQQLAAQELAATGRIADATYQRFEAVGLPRQAVDTYVAATRAQAESATRAIYDAAGGKESFDTMAAWGRVNLPPGDQTSFNLAMQQPDPGIRAMAVQTLRAKYTAANGEPGNLVTNFNPSPPGVSGVQPFNDIRDLTLEMAKPEYKQSPAFRKQVEQRIDASRRAGIDLGLRVINGNTGQRIA